MRRSLHASSCWLTAINVALAAAQLLLFAPIVAGVHSADLIGAPVGLLFRVDGLSLVLGVVWSLAMAVASAKVEGAPAALYVALMSVGMLSMAYARDPWLLYLGWEVAGLCIWQALRSTRPCNASNRVGFALHAAGWPLLLLLLIGVIPPFAPPPGGASQVWPVPVAATLGVVSMIRSGCWPFSGWLRYASAHIELAQRRLVAIYAISAPYLLAKALVAAPWDAYSIWALTLLGAIALLAASYQTALAMSGWRVVAIPAMSAAAIAAFGLASGSPLAAAGALAITLTAIIWASMGAAFAGNSHFLLLGGFAGLWLIAQGALDLGYGLITAILLPAVLLLAVATWERPGIETEHSGGRQIGPLLGLILLTLAAIYPQALIDFAVRPAVGAMAGGVGVPRLLESGPDVGLLVRSPQETLLAALPATGTALAVFLAFAVLYWLKRLARVSEGEETEAQRE